ncbi:MAG TPA: hypothetical protein VHB73_00325 [Alphaproteobacteria bacterium]|nr:hypothetical protein [Alphaproteobacteria bacterium]
MADGNKVALHSRSISKEADKAWCEENFTPASISHGDYSEMITCKDNKKMIQRIPEDRKITYAGSEWNKCIDSAACNQSLIRTEEGMLSWFYPSQAVCFDRAVLRYRSAKGEIKDFPMDDGSPAVPLPPSCTQPFNYLFSIRDEATGKYLIYVHPTGFDPRNWYAHAWWFDPAVATLEPLVFPKGPWMRKDGFLRQLAHFETGCDGLRGMRLMAGRGKIFAGIAGKSECMDKDAGGIYALNEAKTAWVKMVPGEEPADIVNNVFGSYRQPLRGTAVPVLSADGCRIARKGNGGIAVFDVCGGNSSP